MDYVDFVVHIFLTEKRAYYDIERLRKSARTVDLEQLKAMLVEKTAVARSQAGEEGGDCKKDCEEGCAQEGLAKKASRTQGG